MLELIILTGMRADAVRLARFDEFDLAAGVWTIPQARMKKLGRDQRIPLGPRAIEIVGAARRDRWRAAVRRVARRRRPDRKNEAASCCSELLAQIGHDGHAVAHGFRSRLQRLVPRNARLSDGGDRAGARASDSIEC